jgi:hypothetical protein
MSPAIRIAILLAATLPSPALAQTSAIQSATPTRSATTARDIGGFALGMHIREAAKLSHLEDIGNGQFETVRGGVKYDFSVTDAGRIYRIASSQTLGQFAVDNAFLRSVRDKLTAKFGSPREGSAGSFSWELIEAVPRVGGQTLPFATNWASARVGGYSDGVTIDMTMIDFRLLWRDEAAANKAPRSAAESRVSF